MGKYDDPVIAAASDKQMKAMIWQRVISRDHYHSLTKFVDADTMVVGQLYQWEHGVTAIEKIEHGKYVFYDVQD